MNYQNGLCSAHYRFELISWGANGSRPMGEVGKTLSTYSIGFLREDRFFLIIKLIRFNSQEEITTLSSKIVEVTYS